MPPTRELAYEFNISRNTVIEIYEQLVSEQYLVSKQGSGTFVAELNLNIEQKASMSIQQKEKVSSDLISIVAGIPDLTLVPKKELKKVHKEIIDYAQDDLYKYQNPSGYLDLKNSLRKYLMLHKGISCEINQIIITCGTKDSFNILSHSLKGVYNSLIHENPCIKFAQDVFKFGGYDLIDAKVDFEGNVIDSIKDKPKSLIYVSSAHQFPMGGTMSIKRRQDLIALAKSKGHFILEDDYDSEFKYKGACVNSLFQLDDNCVVHIGTFSKTLFPSLRLGYMVVPKNISNVIEDYVKTVGCVPCGISQAIVSKLIDEGVYEKHIYTITKKYKAKNEFLLSKLYSTFGAEIIVNGIDVGLHLYIEFVNIVFTEEVKKRIYKSGLVLKTFNDYLENPTMKDNALIFGYGNLSLEEISKAVDVLYIELKGDNAY